MRSSRALAAGVLAAALLAGGCHTGDDDALSVVIALPDQQLPGAATKATLLVDYSGTGARLLSEGGGPACAFILPGVDGDFADDRKGTLTIHASGPRATRGPADIAACRMKSGDEGATADQLASKLSVRVQAAEDAAGKPIDLTASPVKHTASAGGGGEKSERDVEEAQEAAVKAAAAVVASQPRPEPGVTAGQPAGGQENPPKAAPPASPGGVFPPANSATAPKAPAAAARPAAPAAVRPAAIPTAQQPVDNSAVPTGQDRDPGYDDSLSDDETAPAYSLDFFVQTPGRFGALQLEITHLGSSGGFIGHGDKVDCVSLVEAIVASNYPGERNAKIGLISLSGIRTPAAIMRCGFRTRESLSPASFLIEVTDASDTDSTQIEPVPAVMISTITPRR